MAAKLAFVADQDSGAMITGKIVKGRFIGEYAGWPNARTINVAVKKIEKKTTCAICRRLNVNLKDKFNRVTVGVGSSGAKYTFTWPR